MSEGNANKQLVRPFAGRMVAGVCAGLGDYFGVDPNLVRVAFAALSLFGGAGVLMYVVAWAVVPEEGEGKSIAEGYLAKKRGDGAGTGGGTAGGGSAAGGEG
ncbi:MAG: PspC domain-containing protein [Actinobacteria bacterium]|nr:PspC domain-containing protein [Actinomycetota bacterium]